MQRTRRRELSPLRNAAVLLDLIFAARRRTAALTQNSDVEEMRQRHQELTETPQSGDPPRVSHALHCPLQDHLDHSVMPYSSGEASMLLYLTIV